MATTTRDWLGWTGGGSAFQPKGMSSPVQTGAIHHSPTSLRWARDRNLDDSSTTNDTFKDTPGKITVSLPHYQHQHDVEPAESLLNDSRARHDVNKLHGVCDTSNVIGKGWVAGWQLKFLAYAA